jgi:hypothetical protein
MPKKLTRKEFDDQVENSKKSMRIHSMESGYDLNKVGSSIRFEKSLIIKLKSRT